MKKLKIQASQLMGYALMLLIAVACTSQVKEQKATGVDQDVVIVANGNIITMNSEQPKASAMAFQNGKILAVGDLAAVKKVAGSKYEYHDLEGKTVVPGFIESHDHIVQFGGALEYLDITPFTCPTLKEALQKLKAQGQPNEDGWIYAWAVDQTLYEEKRGPTIQELDELFPDIPVFIFHMSGHGGFANSKAFEMAGVNKDTPNPQGGTIEKDENGELNGYLNGMPAWMMVGKMPAITYESTLNSAKYHARHGFTTATEFALMNSNMLNLLEEATQQPGFPVRVYGGMFITIPGLDEIAPQVKNYETPLFKVPYIKTWTDGSTQGGTGYFSEPFHKLEADTKDGARGTQEQFNEELTTMLNLGFAPGIHANGDAAMDLALNAIEYAREKTGNTSIRPHLIHCQYVRDDQFDRIQKMGNIGMTFFTPHVYFWGDMHRDVLIGPERAAQVSSMNKAIERGIPYAIHNDPPVNNPVAIHSMWVAVNRLTSSGELLGPDQRITPEQALHAYTYGAAEVLGLEDEIGSLETGKYADFVVLSHNPMEVDPMKIKDIQVLTTVMNGQITHQVALHGLYHHH
jgi:predicted amidohydrolase YtcJ